MNVIHKVSMCCRPANPGSAWKMTCRAFMAPLRFFRISEITSIGSIPAKATLETADSWRYNLKITRNPFDNSSYLLCG